METLIAPEQPLRLDAATTDLTPAVLKNAYRSVPSSVVAICAVWEPADGGEEPLGMVVASFVTVSLDPALVSFCVMKSSTTWPKLSALPRLGVSVLGDFQTNVARQIAAKNADRFAGVNFHRTAEGAVLLDGAPLWLDCSLENVVEAGDHEIVILRINSLSDSGESTPAIFHNSEFKTLSCF